VNQTVEVWREEAEAACCGVNLADSIGVAGWGMSGPDVEVVVTGMMRQMKTWLGLECAVPKRDGVSAEQVLWG
jgi:hypothetical protein